MRIAPFGDTAAHRNPYIHTAVKITSIALFLTATFLPGSALAQGSCPDNVFPITFVDVAGQPLPVQTGPGGSMASASDNGVYLALPFDTPSGIYYLQVSNLGISTVLATPEQLDRVFEVVNDGGQIWVSRLSSTLGLPEPGVGLGGVGQSIPVFPLVAPEGGVAPCTFKAWLGTCYSSSWSAAQSPLGLPWGVLGGTTPSGECCVRSYANFRIGDGSGTSAVSGVAFEDLDQDGLQGAGEPGLPGLQVCLSTGEGQVCVLTAADGSYSFPAVPAGAHEITLVTLPDSDYVATTPLSSAVDAGGCASVAGSNFGLHRLARTCQGRTPGFWSNPNGKQLILQHNLLARLPALSVRAANGGLFVTTDYNTYRSWIHGGGAVNMAHKLSQHVVAMDFNRAVGFVDGGCRVDAPLLGTVTIDELLALAVASLDLHGSTPPKHPERAWQELLKNALDAANNNQNWQ